jgi:hypothetical protein
MMGQRSVAFSRRAALAVAMASLALVRPESSSAAVIQQRGMVGGGLVALQGGATAHVSIFATESTFPDKRTVVVGSIRWVEAGTGLSMMSSEVTSYGDWLEMPEGRRIRGTMNVDGAGSYPFVLNVADAGAPGSGQDVVTLTVGEDGSPTSSGTPYAEDGTPTTETDSFHYQVSGLLVIGDIQDVDIDIPFD